MTEKRMAGTYEVIHAFEIGKKEIIIGEDRNASPDERFVVANYENNGIFERYVDALVGNDYAEISNIFAERIKNEAELVFGCEPNSRGSACFCTNLYSGKESRYERRDILGVIEKDKLPEWAKQRFDEIQKERAEKRKERDAR